MAPCPEEVDVFTIPHSRMKTLVEKYLSMLTSTNFSNVVHLTSLLQNLINTFHEFKAHEQIENKFIMKKLKHKLRALSIQNTAVCNCHKDDQLTDMLDLLQDGYRCTKKSDRDRLNFGIQLKQALENFTKNFLPHMAEEEEVFQPLLMQYFSVEELKQIKATVIQEHFSLESDRQEKFVEDIVSCKVANRAEKDFSQERAPVFPKTSISCLADEMILKIFSYLNAQDLCRTAQVSRRWNDLSFDGSLWRELYPVQWSRGDWNACSGLDFEDKMEDALDRLHSSKVLDEDADIDECEDTDAWDTEALEIQAQSNMLTSLYKFVLPRVGPSVSTCNLAYSKGITNGTLYKILSLCHNLEHLDLTQTRVSDLGFKGLLKAGVGRHLKHVDLTGCLYITDVTLQRLATAVSKPAAPRFPITQPSLDDLDNRPDNNWCCARMTMDRNDNENVYYGRNSGRGMKKQDQLVTGYENGQISEVLIEIERAECCGGNTKNISHERTNGRNICPCDTDNCDNDLAMGRDFQQKVSPSHPNDSERTQAFIGFSNVRERIISEINWRQTDCGCRVCSHSLSSSCENTSMLVDSSRHVFHVDGELTDHRFFKSRTLTSDQNIFKTCELQAKTLHSITTNVPNVTSAVNGLEFLSLSGCYRITDEGLRHLSEHGGQPALTHLDLSGCLNLTADGLTALVDTCIQLDPQKLFYCDNILDGPYGDVASGCQNLQCPAKMCCRCGD